MTKMQGGVCQRRGKEKNPGGITEVINRGGVSYA